MKKLLVLAVLVLFAGAVYADSSLYVKALPIAKITAAPKGYKVIYLNAQGDPRVIYVPLEWFYQTGDYRTDDGFVKADMYLGQDASYPYIQFFWKNGVFNHLRIFARSDKSDPSWGNDSTPEDFAGKFDPTKPLALKF